MTKVRHHCSVTVPSSRLMDRNFANCISVMMCLPNSVCVCLFVCNFTSFVCLYIMNFHIRLLCTIMHYTSNVLCKLLFPIKERIQYTSLRGPATAHWMTLAPLKLKIFVKYSSLGGTKIYEHWQLKYLVGYVAQKHFISSWTFCVYRS